MRMTAKKTLMGCACVALTLACAVFVGTANPCFFYHGALQEVQFSIPAPMPTLGAATVYTTNITAGEPEDIIAELPQNATGAPPYIYSFVVENSTGGTVAQNTTNGGGTVEAFTFVPSRGGVMYAKVTVVDSSSPPLTSVSNSVAFRVAPPASSVSLAPNGLVADAGQAISLNAMVSGGVGPFNISVLNYTSNVVVYLASGIQPGSNATYTFTQPAPGTVVLVANAVDTGWAYGPGPQESNAVSVNVLSVPSVAISAYPASNVTVGNYVNLTAVASGGSGRFSFAWTVNGMGAQNVSTANASSISIGGNSPGVFTVNLVATDSGTTKPYALRGLGITVRVANTSQPSTTTTTSASTSTSTKQQGSGGGVEGSGGSGVISGGAQGPSVTRTGNGFEVEGLGESASTTLELGGESLGIVGLQITQAYAVILVNGVQHSLPENQAVLLETTKQGSYYAQLTGINYTTSGSSTMGLYVYFNESRSESQGLGAPTLNITIAAEESSANVTLSNSTPDRIMLPDMGATLSIASNVPQRLVFDIRNTTGTDRFVPPEGYNAVLVVNITLGNATVGLEGINLLATILYNCSAIVRPFLAENGTWASLPTYYNDTPPCSMTFHVPPDPVVGVMKLAASYPLGVAPSSRIVGVVSANQSPTNEEQLQLIYGALVIVMLLAAAVFIRVAWRLARGAGGAEKAAGQPMGMLT